MTEPIFPDHLADELLAGVADPSSLSPEVRGIAEVFVAAQQAPLAAELSGMSAAVAAFQGIVTEPVSAPGVPETSRSVSHMFSSRIPKRAAIITAATLLIAGTAAAAAGGAIPSPWASPRVYETKPHSTTTTIPATTTTIEATTTSAGEPTTTAETSTTTGETSTTTAADVTTTTVYPGRDFGLCTAWTHGAEKPLNPAFQYLADQASADAAAGAPVDPNAADPTEDQVRAGVDTYCEKVIADKKGQQADDSDDEATSAEDETAEPATTPTRPSHATDHPNGNGKGHGKP